MTTAGPHRDAPQDTKAKAVEDGISDAERELYGGRLRYDQSYVRHEGPLTRLTFGHMAAALPRMVGMVLRTGWETDRRAMAGVVASQLGQGVTAAWGLVAVNSVLTRLFAQATGPPTPPRSANEAPDLSNTEKAYATSDDQCGATGGLPSSLMRRRYVSKAALGV